MSHKENKVNAMLHSLLDNEQDFMDKLDERVKDSMRLGSFFQPWFFQARSRETFIKYFDVNKLKDLCKNIDWIKYDIFINDKCDYNGYDEQLHYISHYLSYIILNQIIYSKDTLDKLLNHSLKIDMSFDLKDECKDIFNNLKGAYDENKLSNIKTKLYIYYDKDKKYVLQFHMECSGFEKPYSITFKEL